MQVSATGLDRLARIAEQYAEWLHQLVLEFGHPLPAAARTASLIARRASTTGRAIALLLAEGYTQDALGRWRSLYELASTAALVARPGTAEIAHRYLVHADVVDDTRFEEDYRDSPYEWARPYFADTRDRRRQRITQTMLFRAADLTLVDYPESVAPANGATHLDSYVVGNLSRDTPGAPYGYDRALSLELCRLSALTLREIVSACALMTTADLPERAAFATACINTEWARKYKLWVDTFPEPPLRRTHEGPLF